MGQIPRSIELILVKRFSIIVLLVKHEARNLSDININHRAVAIYLLLFLKCLNLLLLMACILSLNLMNLNLVSNVNTQQVYVGLLKFKVYYKNWNRKKLSHTPMASCRPIIRLCCNRRSLRYVDVSEFTTQISICS